MREPFCKARQYIVMLLVAEVMLGIMIIVLTYVYHRILSGYLDELECKLLSGQLFNTYLLGIQIIITYFCSIFMWQRLWGRQFSSNVLLLLNLWTLFSSMIVFCGFGSVYYLLNCADSFERMVETSLLTGIDMYYTCAEWKYLWDGLQFHQECCGVYGYGDWVKASWMPSSSGSCLTSNKESVYAPYACCKHDCKNCFENYVSHHNGGGAMPLLNLADINTVGCLPIFKHSMWKILYVLLGLIIVAFNLDILICCMTKYITSKQILDDCEDPYDHSYAEDDPNLLVVKYPSSVRCVLYNQENTTNDSCKNNNPKIGEPITPVNKCQCCSKHKHCVTIEDDPEN
ncbi:uncharacterized protein LOC119689525 [Teleopsis dalmanni]|uniref:uncharacterized protein LOC119689525 n=1 Tax=Teleopsis dalmanni TaxID=139649 RepID=UPI000D32CCEC|nr:uncharacterized protein LOC119689525 [Teleopsis dalmanni]